ncbi:hypothetical protein [Rickettsiales endosymbiont of Stachyamoeba lipophora]|uniref:hypothetical protein n=1 Tax=Rickettsiales endosymbiont of Stachyamoeba lipophora TaxID=2486578 RepID=UPI000F64C3EC|nr:hypothetical protein [Rickettsiales endosymbiont of Stachyamoeba lipophora]AZL15536.1 hypothetical protein EF513_03085 [Rickettsiales endosymbiont of Stachyamoeba lipophora]
MQQYTTPNLGLRVLHPNQANKEYDLNYNLILIDFAFNPQISGFFPDIPDNLNLGEAIIINNPDHLNYNQVIIFIENYHTLKSYQGMKVFIGNQQFTYQHNAWLEEKTLW